MWKVINYESMILWEGMLVNVWKKKIKTIESKVYIILYSPEGTVIGQSGPLPNALSQSYVLPNTINQIFLKYFWPSRPIELLNHEGWCILCILQPDLQVSGSEQYI